MSIFVNKRVYLADKGPLDRMWCIVDERESSEKGMRLPFAES